jgi:hypothetical protein
MGPRRLPLGSDKDGDAECEAESSVPLAGAGQEPSAIGATSRVDRIGELFAPTVRPSSMVRNMQASEPGLAPYLKSVLEPHPGEASRDEGGGRPSLGAAFFKSTALMRVLAAASVATFSGFQLFSPTLQVLRGSPHSRDAGGSSSHALAVVHEMRALELDETISLISSQVFHDDINQVFHIPLDLWKCELLACRVRWEDRSASKPEQGFPNNRLGYLHLLPGSRDTWRQAGISQNRRQNRTLTLEQRNVRYIIEPKDIRSISLITGGDNGIGSYTVGEDLEQDRDALPMRDNPTAIPVDSPAESETTTRSTTGVLADSEKKPMINGSGRSSSTKEPAISGETQEENDGLCSPERKIPAMGRPARALELPKYCRKKHANQVHPSRANLGTGGTGNTRIGVGSGSKRRDATQ